MPSIPVLPYIPSMGVQHTIVREFVTNTYADGYKTLKTKETAFLRANGSGGLSSYKGLNKFVIKFNRMLIGANKAADNLYNFMMSRLDNLNEAFYFYNPTERATPDLTGLDPIGRYHVHFENPNVVLSRDLFRVCCFSHSGIVLLEHKELGTSGDVINAMDPILWNSCPVGLTIANLGTSNDLWFITTVDGGFDEYHTGNPDGPDALYIMKYDFASAAWSYIYLKISDYHQEWDEPDIACVSKGDITVLVLTSVRTTHIQVYVFKANVLINFYESLSYKPSGSYITPDSLLIDSNNIIHLGVKDSSNNFCDLRSTNNGATWTSHVIIAGSVVTTETLRITETNIGLFAFIVTSGYTIFNVYESVNSGVTWTHVSTPTLPHYAPFGFKSWKNDLYILTSDDLTHSLGLSVYKSTDNGATFTKHTIEAYTVGQEKGFEEVALFYSDDIYIYAIGNYYDWISNTNKIRCYRSSDGETWTLRSTIEFAELTSLGVWRDPFIAVKVGTRIYVTAYYPDVSGFYAGTYQLAFMYSDDGGVTWTFVRTPFYDTTNGGDVRGLDAHDTLNNLFQYKPSLRDRALVVLGGEELKSELYGYYKFEEATGQGDRADSTGLGNTLKNVSAYDVQQVVGKVGYASQFIRSGIIKLETLNNFHDFYLTPFAIAMWVGNPDPNSGGYFNGVVLYTGGTPGSIQFVVQNAGAGGPKVSIQLVDYNFNTYGPFQGHTDLSGALHFWVVRCDGVNIYFECDNAQIGIASNAGMCISGGSKLSLTTAYNVIVDETGLWCRDLSSDERDELWNSGNGMSIF